MTMKLMMDELAKKGIRARMLAVDYPLAPEYPYPAALDACVSAYDYYVNQSGCADDFMLGKTGTGCFGLST
jgi:epsilon-lactone hydrolase